MAIKQKQISETLVKTWSDAGVYIHGGSPEGDYTIVVDPIAMNRQYVETDKKIPNWRNPEDIRPEEALAIITGEVEQDEA